MTTPVIDLTIHSNDNPYWRITMHTPAARHWAASQLDVPVGRLNPDFDTPQDEALIASAREAGLVLSFSASLTPMQFGVA